jgi:hypothetical protein
VPLQEPPSRRGRPIHRCCRLNHLLVAAIHL